MEQSAIEFSQFVLNSDQFSEYHAQQNKKRTEEIQAQKEKIGRKSRVRVRLCSNGWQKIHSMSVQLVSPMNLKTWKAL